MSLRRLVAWFLVPVVAFSWVASLFFEISVESTPFDVPALLAMILGALLVLRVGGNAVGVVMAVGGASWIIYEVAPVYARASLAGDALPGEYLAAWLGGWLGPFFFLSFPALLVLFPGGRIAGWRRGFLALIGLVAAFVIFGGTQLWGIPAEVLTDLPALDLHPGYVYTDVAFGISLFLAVPATFSVVSRFRRGTVVERQQIKWLLGGAIALAVSLISILVLEGTVLWAVMVAVGMTLFPAAVAVAIFRYRLYDLGRVVSRTVTYAIVVGLLGAGAAIAATLVGTRFRDPLWVAGTTLGVAALFSPLRSRVQAAVERRFNRSRYDAERVMDEFAGSLRDRVTEDRVILGWVDVVSDTMEPDGVGVWIRR